MCEHEATKADPVRWAALPLLGVQVCVEGDPDLEIRLCPHCHTSMSIEIKESK